MPINGVIGIMVRDNGLASVASIAAVIATVRLCIELLGCLYCGGAVLMETQVNPIKYTW